jgi:hypothetical protein
MHHASPARRASATTLFDRDDDDAIQAATEICAACPVLNRCRQWLRATPAEHRPHSMVIAGRYREPTKIQLQPRRDPEARTHPSRDRAVVWLRAYLSEHAPVLSAQVFADAIAAGISLTALRRARLDLHVQLTPVPGPKRHFMWS